jgi:hypothetical protein
MSDYVILAVNPELVPRIATAIGCEIQMYKPYTFEVDDQALIIEGAPYCGHIVIGDNKHYIAHPTRNGFVVKRVYTKDPDEPDPVLREWGKWQHLSLWNMDDKRLQNWLREQLALIDPRFNDRLYSSIKTKHRVRCFGPRRSEKFYPKISLWQSLEHRDEDRLTAMKPARAFALMFPELEHKQLIMLNDAYLKEFAPRDFTVHTSKEAADFRRAYAGEQSPNENIDTTCRRKHLASSCMRYDFEHLPNHPAEAYASGDFLLVYATDQNGKIAGRCVVYDDKRNLYSGPVYGVSEQAIDCIEDKLTELSVAVGSDGDWVGAKLKRMEYDGGFIGPYLDLTPQTLTDNGSHLVVDYRGEVDASQYQGILGGHHTHCCNCEDGLSEDEYYYSEHTGEHYCESCYYNDHVYCDYYEESVHVDVTTVCYRIGYHGQRESVQVFDGILQDGDLFIQCTDDEYWHVDDITYCEYSDVWVSPDEMDGYFHSDWDGELYPKLLLCTTVDGETVSKYELDIDSGIWQKNEKDQWEQVQEELSV